MGCLGVVPKWGGKGSVGGSNLVVGEVVVVLVGIGVGLMIGEFVLVYWSLSW